MWYKFPDIEKIVNAGEPVYLTKNGYGAIQIEQEKLRELGWRVFIIWECELKKDFLETMERLERELKRNNY